jgi:probable HAF family extracellular repeat protein
LGIKMKKNIINLILATILTGMAFLANAAYKYSDLGTLGGNVSVSRSINNYGQVVGTSFDSGNDKLYAAQWNSGVISSLGSGAGINSQAYSINNVGQVVGYIDGVASLWDNGSVSSLGSLGGNFSIAWDINNVGQVAGYGTTAGNTSQQALLWNLSPNGNTVTSLGTLGGNYSQAWGVNDLGHVAGFSYNSNNEGRATFWKDGNIINLGTLGGNSSDAQDLNNFGQIVGYASSINGGNQATLWNFTEAGITTIDLGTATGITESLGLGINNLGQIVGAASFQNGFNRHAALWVIEGNSIVAIDLNNFIDETLANEGWILTQANDINDIGWIVGDAYNVITGQTHGFQLTPDTNMSPIPEPETYSMMLIGIAMLGLMAGRRKNT